MVLIRAQCPYCQRELEFYKNPKPTADAIIAMGEQGVVLVRRREFPFGWAIPGGFVEYGESVEEAAQREAREETGLDIRLLGLLGVYSAPGRDPRGHTVATVFYATASGTPRPGDDAAEAAVFPLHRLPSDLAFDHARILQDYLRLGGPTR